MRQNNASLAIVLYYVYIYGGRLIKMLLPWTAIRKLHLIHHNIEMQWHGINATHDYQMYKELQQIIEKSYVPRETLLTTCTNSLIARTFSEKLILERCKIWRIRFLLVNYGLYMTNHRNQTGVHETTIAPRISIFVNQEFRMWTNYWTIFREECEEPSLSSVRHPDERKP